MQAVLELHHDRIGCVHAGCMAFAEHTPKVARQILLPCTMPKQAVKPLLLASKRHSSCRARPLSIWPHMLSRAFRRRLGSLEAALGSTSSHLVMFLQAYVAADRPLKPCPSKTPTAQHVKISLQSYASSTRRLDMHHTGVALEKATLSLRH